MPPVGYIAYIDEAGDDGLRIKVDGERKASDWMIMSAVVIRTHNEPKVLGWVKNLIKNLGQHQLTHLHFRTLNDEKRSLVCGEIARLPLRSFIVLSNKHNMIGYRNIRAEKAKVNRTAWFYCWMSRLLLEKVTAYCGRRTIKDYGTPRPIQLEFSDRGGVRIADIRKYYQYLHDQSKLGMMFHHKHDLDWSVFDHDQLYTYPNKMRAGLQLSDCVASAFFAGLEPATDGSTRPEPAKLLWPNICRDMNGRRYGFGVRTMPVWVHGLPPNQANLRDYYLPK